MFEHTYVNLYPEISKHQRKIFCQWDRRRKLPRPDGLGYLTI